MRRTLLTLTAVSALVSGSAHPVTTGFNGGAQTTPIFRLQADGFWLNLHHFLYVLGRAEAQMPDRQRRAVAAAPRFDPLLTHALIFFTAGEAVRSIDAQQVPYAEGNGLWRQKGLGAFKAALDRSWKPYLEGKGTLDEALRALLKAQPAG